VFLTELTSNIATTTALAPMIAALGVALGMEPLKLVIPATMAASCAFMLPVATPPNAVIFGARLLSIPQMARVGFWVNLVAIVAVTLVSHFAIELLLFWAVTTASNELAGDGRRPRSPSSVGVG